MPGLRYVLAIQWRALATVSISWCPAARRAEEMWQSGVDERCGKTIPKNNLNGAVFVLPIADIHRRLQWVESSNWRAVAARQTQIGQKRQFVASNCIRIAVIRQASYRLFL